MTDFLRICAGVFVMSTILGGCNLGHDFSDFDALTIARTGSFELDMAPEANIGTVDVSIDSNGNGGTTVNVAYQLTGLSPAGSSYPEESFSESNYAEIMEEWRTMINNSRVKIDDHFGR